MGLGLGFVRPHRIEREAAERLIDLIPSAEMVKFGINASDATTAAVRLARAYTGRNTVAICRDHPFFSTDDWCTGTIAMAAGIPDEIRRLTVGFSYNHLDDLARVLAAHAPRTDRAGDPGAGDRPATGAGLLRRAARAVRRP